MSRFHSNIKSFGHAIDGIKTAFKKEPNLQIHLTIGVLVLALAGILRFSIFEWIVLLFTVALVIALELINTSVESIVDLVSPEIKPQAKIAKDVAAAAVLVTAIISIIIGVLLFLPNIIDVFKEIK